MTGRYPRYRYPKWFSEAIQAHGRETADASRARGVSETRFWRYAMGRWDSLTAVDLHQHFGIDLLDEAVLRRPWWWLHVRIRGLLDIPEARLSRWAVEASK